jgi:aminopeptidase C
LSLKLAGIEKVECLAGSGTTAKINEPKEGGSVSDDSDDVLGVDDYEYEADLDEVATLMKKTCAELKELLRGRNLKVSGNKTKLVNCLLGIEDDQCCGEENIDDLVISLDTLQQCSVKQLKQKLKSMGLPKEGGSVSDDSDDVLGVDDYEYEADLDEVATLMKKAIEGTKFESKWQ